MEPKRPTWQHSDCPAWCTREHTEIDHEDDRDHQSDATIVPVVRLLKQFEGSQLQREAVADEVAMVVFQHQADDEWWLSLGLAQQDVLSLHLSQESAGRLARSLHALLGQLGR